VQSANPEANLQSPAAEPLEGQCNEGVLEAGEADVSGGTNMLGWAVDQAGATLGWRK